MLYFIHFSKKAAVSSDVFNSLQYILHEQNLCKNTLNKRVVFFSKVTFQNSCGGLL